MSARRESALRASRESALRASRESALRASRESALRASLWLLLGAWIGALVLFAMLVAPSAFRVAGRELAGRLVGEILPPLTLAGSLVGLALAGLGRGLGRGGAAVALPLVLSALGLLSLFGITPLMDEADPATFRVLHRASVSIYALTGVGVFALVGIHARREVREQAKKTRPVP